MKLTIAAGEQREGTKRVTVEGRITQREVSPFEEPLGELLGAGAYAQRVLLDLGRTDVVDSSGVGWLMVCHKRAREAGGQLVLHTIPPAVLNTFRLLKLDQVFLLAASENEALRLDQGNAT